MTYGVPRIMLYSKSSPSRVCSSARARCEIEALARNELHHLGDAVHGDDGDLSHRVDRHSAPVRAADSRRHQQRASRAGWREDAFVPQRRDRGAAGVAIGSVMPQISIDREPMRAERRCERRERLRARRPAPPGCRSLARRAPRPGKWADPSLARARTACRSSSPGRRPHALAVARDRDERRWRGVVVIPQIVMNRLERPDQPACRGAQRDDRVGVPVVAKPQHAVVVRRGAARRHEDEVAVGIRDQGGPCVGAATLVRDRAAPFGVCRIARVLRDRIPGPSQLPVRASYPRTSPLAGSGLELSPIDDPVMTTPFTTTGGDVMEYACGSNGGMRRPALRSTDAVYAEVTARLPSRASRAMSCDCAVAAKIRRRHAASAGAASSSHVDTPRLAKSL